LSTISAGPNAGDRGFLVLLLASEMARQGIVSPATLQAVGLGNIASLAVQNGALLAPNGAAAVAVGALGTNLCAAGAPCLRGVTVQDLMSADMLAQRLQQQAFAFQIQEQAQRQAQAGVGVGVQVQEQAQQQAQQLLAGLGTLLQQQEQTQRQAQQLAGAGAQTQAQAQRQLQTLQGLLGTQGLLGSFGIA
jgi:hypothetical protein